MKYYMHLCMPYFASCSVVSVGAYVVIACYDVQMSRCLCIFCFLDEEDRGIFSILDVR